MVPINFVAHHINAISVMLSIFSDIVNLEQFPVRFYLQAQLLSEKSDQHEHGLFDVCLSWSQDQDIVHIKDNFIEQSCPFLLATSFLHLKELLLCIVVGKTEVVIA